jgi:hypothetical protein
MVRITCEACRKPLSIDETKLPMQPVSFPCPVCKEKMTVDRRELQAGSETREPAMAVTAAAEQEEDELGNKALIVGADSPQVRQAARSIGLTGVVADSADAGREIYLREYPEVVFLAPVQLTPPPMSDLTPMLSLSPGDRRRGFFILLAEQLRTFDGNAAFLYGVNLTVSTRDLGSFRQIYREARLSHDRLYGSMNAEREQL